MLIPYLLYDVTGRINPRMNYAFCLLHIEEFWKLAIPIIWCYRQLQSPNSSLWLHAKHCIALTKRESVWRILFSVITDQDWPCQHIDQWPRKTRESTTALIEEFENWRSPLFGATGNFNHQILPYGILFLTFICTNVFYLLSFKFSR
jgi:hypothetical protein